jgi:hypothetical protein
MDDIYLMYYGFFFIADPVFQKILKRDEPAQYSIHGSFLLECTSFFFESSSQTVGDKFIKIIEVMKL